MALKSGNDLESLKAQLRSTQRLINSKQELRESSIRDNRSISPLIVSCCVMLAYSTKDTTLSQKVREIAESFAKNPNPRTLEKLKELIQKSLEQGRIDRFVNDSSKQRAFEKQIRELNEKYSIGLSDYKITELCMKYSNQKDYIQYIEELCERYINNSVYVNSNDDELSKHNRELQKIARQIEKITGRSIKAVMAQDEKTNGNIDEAPAVNEFESKVEMALGSNEAWLSVADIVKENPNEFLHNPALLSETVEKVSGLQETSPLFRQLLDHIETVLRYKAYGSVDTIDDLNELAKIMLDADFGRYAGAYDKNSAASLFLKSICEVGVIEKYEGIYNSFMNTHPGLSQSEIVKAITPKKLIEMYNQRVEKLILDALPDPDTYQWENIQKASFRMPASQIAAIYIRYRDNGVFERKPDEVKADVQRMFVHLIESHHMRRVDDLEENNRRYVAICHEYFHEEPYNPQLYENVGDIDDEYAALRVEAADLVKGQRLRYYQQNKLNQVLGAMKLSKLNKLAKKDVLTEEEKETIRSMW